MSKIKFTPEDEEKIIDFVKSNEMIFNVQHKQYRNSELKNRLWTEFAQSLGKDVDNCIKKWSNIREFYKKSKNPNKMGTGSCAKSKIRLEHLSFLDGVDLVIRDKTISNIKSKPTNTVASAISFEGEEEIQFGPELNNSTVESDSSVNNAFHSMPLSIDTKPEIEATNMFCSTSGLFDLETTPVTVTVPSIRHNFKRCGECSVQECAGNTTTEHTQLLKTLRVHGAQPKEELYTPMQRLFLSFADIVSQFPERSQIETKKKVFNIINEEEMKLALKKENMGGIESMELVEISNIKEEHRDNDFEF